MEAEDIEAIRNETATGFRGVAVVPTVARDPVPQFRTAVLTSDQHQADRADELSGFVFNDCESSAGSGVPRRSLTFNPRSCGSNGVGMRNVERRIRDLTHTGELLDIPRVVQHEGAQH